MERRERQSRDGARHHEMSEQDVIEPNGVNLHAYFNAYFEESFHFVDVSSEPWANGHRCKRVYPRIALELVRQWRASPTRHAF
jgi:hypothetical protein